MWRADSDWGGATSSSTLIWCQQPHAPPPPSTLTPMPCCAKGAAFTLALVSKPTLQVVLACKLTCLFSARARMYTGATRKTLKHNQDVFLSHLSQFLSFLHFLPSVELLLLLRKTSEFGADVPSHHCVSVGRSCRLPPQSQTCFPWLDNHFDCYESNHSNNAALVGNLTFGSILISCLTLCWQEVVVPFWGNSLL